MLTDKELKQLFKIFKIKCRGIYLKDELKPVETEEGFYIYNLDSKTKPVMSTSLGTHWTCSVGNDKQAMYFDSYGVVPPNEISYFLKLKYDKYMYNNYIIQDLNSTNCGFYCLGLALYVKENQATNPNLMQTCNEYINMFGDNARTNDVILRDFLYKMAKKHKVLNPATTTLLEKLKQKYDGADDLVQTIE